MADDIRSLSALLARDPGSVAFLRLGEMLRSSGQLDAAERVVLAGMERHPRNAPARDLHARILADRGRLREAEQRWLEALEIEPRLVPARKGLGFLCFRAGDLDGALDHLEIALSADPTDQSVVQGIRRVREAMMQLESDTAELDRADFIDAGDDQRVVLSDARGLVLAGAIHDSSGRDVSDATAAHVAGVSNEAERSCRMLGLGEWEWIVAEAPGGNVHVTRPTAESLLLLIRDRSIPAGRLAWVADRAVAAARAWIAEELD